MNYWDIEGMAELSEAWDNLEITADELKAKARAILNDELYAEFCEELALAEGID